jgi:hypothetical protein
MKIIVNSTIYRRRVNKLNVLQLFQYMKLNSVRIVISKRQHSGKRRNHVPGDHGLR